MSATSSQLEDLNSLRGEIDGIAQAARRAAPESGDGVVENVAGLSYSMGILSSPEQTVTAIVDSIRETLSNLAPVATFETSRDSFTARTVINYTGFTVSVWCAGPSSELIDAHLSMLHSAYLFRAAVAAVIAAVGNALLSISIAIANPLTALEALRSAEALRRAVEHLAATIAAGALIQL